MHFIIFVIFYRQMIVPSTMQLRRHVQFTCIAKLLCLNALSRQRLYVPLSMYRKVHLGSPNSISESAESCVTKSRCFLGRSRLMAMSFKSSTKNRWFIVALRLTEGPIWNLFYFFNKNDCGFTERMDKNTQ